MDYTALSYVFLYGGAIFFSGIAISRETMLSGLIAGFWWLATALFSFILLPTGMGIAFGWIMAMICFVFMGVFFYRLFAWYFERKNERFAW